MPVCVLVAGLNQARAAEPGAQQANGQPGALEEVIVTARRRTENLQNVPLTVNAVSSEDLQKLNIRDLSSIQSVVPGLTMTPNTIAPNASLRGVSFYGFASGNNPTVQFYLNDAPTVSTVAMQALFDIKQIEVLRGPQGTVRGRAAPSGAITITTEKPDLEKFGGYADLTATNEGGKNARGALNVPLIRDMLGFRIAGLFNKDKGARIKSINNNNMSETTTNGYRASLRFEPMDTLSVDLMYQRLKPRRLDNFQVESANRADPSLPPPTQGDISASDHLGVTDFTEKPHQTLEQTNLNVKWEIGGVNLEYIGALTTEKLNRTTPQDYGDFWGPGSAPALQTYSQALDSKADDQSHELRMETTMGRFDLVAGGLYEKLKPKNDVTQQTAIFNTVAAGGGFLIVVDVPVKTSGESTEKSLYTNVTWHLTDATELAAGLRYIDYKNTSLVVVNGSPIQDISDHWHKLIYMASLKHRFSDEVMAYTTVGSSWRPGVSVIGDFSSQQTALEQSFQNLNPERSTSFEVGMKSNWLDNRLRLNGDVYYQKFDNYVYRTSGSGVYYVSTDSSGVETVNQFNFVAAVPVNVYGVELEANFQATEHWTMGAVFSWSDGKIDNGTVPCDVYGGTQPTIAGIRAASGGDNLAACKADFRSSSAPPWSVTLRSEYSFPLVAGTQGFVRGLLTGYSDSKNDPTNKLDDVNRYAILDLYAGIRDPEGRWQVMFFGKNVTNTQRVLTREATPYSVSFQRVDLTTFAVTGDQGSSTYRHITVTNPREYGINFRYNF